MKFKYTALTKEGKKATGVFDVESQEAAQAELHKMGVAIISLAEITEEEYQKELKEQEKEKKKTGIETYTFVAIDPNSNEAEGTIDALDEYSAYKRLITEYQFKVKNIYPEGASPEVIAKAEKKIPEYEQNLEIDLAKEKKERGKRGEEEEEAEPNPELIAEIDKVIINTKKVIAEYKDLYSIDAMKEIEATLGELELIRTSNNVAHIQEISNSLYTLIKHPDKAEGAETEKISAFNNTIGDIGESGIVKNEFDIYKKALHLEALKENLSILANRLKDLLKPKEGEGEKPGFIQEIKKKAYKKLDELSRLKERIKKKAEIKRTAKEKSKILILMQKVRFYLKADNPILKNARKKELIEAIKNIFKKSAKPKKKIKAVTKEKEDAEKPLGKTRLEGIAQKIEEEKTASAEALAKTGKEEAEEEEKPKRKWDFAGLITEIDSFLGWLLCFYIIYFFLAAFSLEKNVGLSKVFVLKTLQTPLLLNISIFLLIMHFTFRLKNLHFRQNILAGIFLLALSLGIYTFLIINF